MIVLRYDNETCPAPPGAPTHIAFYDSIQELPMFRLNEFQIHLSQDSGLGSTIQDWDTRLASINTALWANDAPTARREMYNARLGLFLMLDSISTAARCLADLVYAIDEKPVADFTEDNMMRIHDAIQLRLTQKQASEIIDELKKKFIAELRTSFPVLFPDDDEIVLAAQLIKRAKLLLADFEAGIEAPNREIDIIDDWLREQFKPENFDETDSANSVEEKRRNFEQVCAGLAQHNIPNAELLTAYKFHARILYFKTQNKPKQDAAISENL
jgi:hypothetical protein